MGQLEFVRGSGLTHRTHSLTDFSVFTEHGLPGLDVAFYRNRYLYHSPKDIIYPGTTFASIQHMGANLLANVRDVAGDARWWHLAEAARPPSDASPAAYWDEYGRFTLLSFDAYSLACVGIGALLLFGFLVTPGKGPIRPVLRSLALHWVGIALALVLVSGTASPIDWTAPLAFYGQPGFWILHVLLGAAVGLYAPHAEWHGGSADGTADRRRLESFHQARHAGTLFWAGASLLTAASAKACLGMFYCIPLYWAAAHGLGEVVRYVWLRANGPALPSAQPRRELVLCLLQLCLPLHLMHGFLQALLEGMAPTLIDGTPSATLSVLVLVFVGLPLLAALPWVRLAGGTRSLVLGLLALDVLLCVYLVGIGGRPFTESTPLKLMLQQQWNLTRGSEPDAVQTYVQFHRFRGSDGALSLAGRPLRLEACSPMRTLPDYFRVCRVVAPSRSTDSASVAPPTLPPEPLTVEMGELVHLDGHMRQVRVSVTARDTIITWVRWRAGEEQVEARFGPDAPPPASLFRVALEEEEEEEERQSSGSSASARVYEEGPEAPFCPRFQALRNYGAAPTHKLRITYNATAIRAILSPPSAAGGELQFTAIEVGCSYDDVTLRMPAWQQFVEGLPPWALLHAKGSPVLVFHTINLDLR